MQLAVSAWSFHQALYGGKLRQTEIPGRVADLGFKYVELLEMFLQPRPPGRLARLLGRAAVTDATRPDYSRATLSELRAARLRTGIRLACWAIDSDLTLPNPDARKAQLAHMATALEAARYLGAPLVRLTAGRQVDDVTGFKRAADMLRNVVVVAATLGLRLAIENHGESPQALAEIVKAINHPGVGICLDVGNFAEGQFARGLELLAPLAIHVHAKTRRFTPDGHEAQIDYGAALSALRAAGYDGIISIEYEGDDDPVEGIRKTQALIERYWR